jgi:hypothetical protein
MPDVTERIRRGLDRWASPQPAEDAALLSSSADSGCVSVSECGDRVRVRVQGTLQAVSLRPRGGVPALEAELYDGSGTLTVVWLGRRAIPGIDPGRCLLVEGRIGRSSGSPVMFNPRYELCS